MLTCRYADVELALQAQWLSEGVIQELLEGSAGCGLINDGDNEGKGEEGGGGGGGRERAVGFRLGERGFKCACG